MRIGSLFSGIGGLELGLEWSGIGHTVWQVEQAEFCRRVLERHWPNAERFDDVRAVGAATLAPADLICGGFPCQDISSAGSGKGLAGERSGLWFEFARVIDEMRPLWVVVENVASGGVRWVNAVAAQLVQLGYEALPLPVSAEDVGAPHLRKRIFIVAANTLRGPHPDAKRGGRETLQLAVGDPDCLRKLQPEGSVAEFGRRPSDPGWWSTEPDVGRVAHGIPARAHRLRALGNAVVPQCAEVVGWVIRELEAQFAEAAEEEVSES